MHSKLLAIVALAVTAGWAAPAAAYFGPERTEVPQTRADRQSSDLTTRSVEALLHGHTQRAIDLSTEAIAREPSNGWAYYARANALSSLGKTESAVEDYDSAIALSGKDVWGRSVAIYGRARALDAADRCAEATQSYQEYARLVAPFEPKLAANARQYSGYCKAASIDANAARQKIAAMKQETRLPPVAARPAHHEVAAMHRRMKARPAHHKVAAVCPPTTTKTATRHATR